MLFMAFDLADRSVEELLRDRRLLGNAAADEHGVPVAGRLAELDDLRAVGYRDLVLGRLIEGHGNAIALVSRCGTERQRATADAEAATGHLFGVWNTAPADGVRIVARGDGWFELGGRKTFCSGAGTVTRALITARDAAGSSQMLLVPMDRVPARIDRSSWDPLGMRESDSFAVDFSGVRLESDAAIGDIGDYDRQPWFGAGAARFVAVQAGGIVRLADELAAFAVRRSTGDDAVQMTRLGECVVAARTAAQWVRACAEAWAAWDIASTAEHEKILQSTVDAARYAIERAALDVLERVERAVGARGLLAPEPFAALVRDLRMYLRQPAPDLAISRVGRNAFERASAE
jgi:alkylation response protein AidB-like acyl-CoA dehydrogenase